MKELLLVAFTITLCATPAQSGVWDDCKQRKDIELRIRACTQHIEQTSEEQLSSKPEKARFLKALQQRAEAYMKKRKFDAAIHDYTRVIKLGHNVTPARGSAFYNRGLAYAKKGELDNTIADFSKAIKIWPQNGAYYYFRAEAYTSAGKLRLALADFNQAIALKFPVYFSRGLAHHLLGEVDLAIKDYGTAIDFDWKKYRQLYLNMNLTPGSHDMWWRRQALFMYFGNLDKRYYDRAHYNRGVLYLKKGEKAKAIADFSKAVEINPLYTRAKDALKDLGQAGAAP